MREVMLDRPEAGGACDACSFNVNHSLAERRKLPFENRAKTGFEFRIFKSEAGGLQANRRDSLTFEDRGLRHLAKS
jgi:hypothetical protein